MTVSAIANNKVTAINTEELQIIDTGGQKEDQDKGNTPAPCTLPLVGVLPSQRLELTSQPTFRGPAPDLAEAQKETVIDTSSRPNLSSMLPPS